MAHFGDSRFGGTRFGGDGGSSVVRLSFAEFFLASKKSVVELDTLEIKHKALSRIFYLVANAMRGIQAKFEPDENGVRLEVTFDYCPMRVTPLESTDDLDGGYRIELGDLGKILPAEMDRLHAFYSADLESDEMLEVYYRAYRSDDLSAPMYGPVRLEVGDVTRTREGAAFDAKAPDLNESTIGDTYDVARFPSLRGFAT